MPDYLYAAVGRDAEDKNSELTSIEIEKGKLYAGLLDGVWERVQVIRPSSVKGEKYVVYAVDIGLYHILSLHQMRKLGESTVAFDRMLLAKCKVDFLLKATLSLALRNMFDRKEFSRRSLVS